MKSIILAGGSGTRLWPLSREYFPKQFIKFKKLNQSLFQKTFERSLKLSNGNLEDICIVTNEKYKFLVLGQIEELGLNFPEENILIEPVAKNTLPAIYYGVKHFKKHGEFNIAVFPSDHLIENEELLLETFLNSDNLAKKYLLTFGINPNKPHTGYGYIKPGEKHENGNVVEEFKEKPDLKTAEEYIKAGYLWNSGMFLLNSELFENEVKIYAPELYNAFENFESEDIKKIFEIIPNISIDYGIMEKSKIVAVVPITIKWNDLGSFDAFYDEFEIDENKNITENENICINSSGNLINTADKKIVSLIGIDDAIIVDTRDSLLICKKNQSEKVKNIVNILKTKNDERAEFHKRVYRPWGIYEILEDSEFYKIKKITVLPGKKLSYQLHHHRSEHWVVVKGMAKVTVEGNEYFVRNGESTFVKSGLKHRLENPGKLPLELIEIQIGEYFEEDDIIRFDDEWGRK
ncbi:mannose-1-phosphate guanylyltransferase/mannose-6-phosphate isomerase [Methanococcus maripaludis]|uniref:mannose-1-phosphate guanylyltransferase n=1 Tax=Methanococcus maripaludis X1 TaxID=1053692 RepID=G0H0N0_METMI|nr:mannose-1-phosphate guanylyltransferase/mannose-6-phosphate isomerase [Methanococcus maripaludis]AEK20111.1 mannose-1-phosphate guanylyltransferase/mannose-6-phosphate isomerase [Methanococcus maripaludis X1]